MASCVFLVVAELDVPDEAQFYEAARAIDWRAHIDPARTLACDFTGKHPTITHTRFGSLRLKDAICDQLRDATGRRPDISPERPAVRVHAHANGPKITVSLDLSGEGLHRRGYRTQAGEAPLRENLAAGILLRAGWPDKAAQAAEFLDPMCGSGTLVIEAAMIAAGIAPGARRHYFGFFGWMGHDRVAWDAVKRDAQAREHRPAFQLRGIDADAAVLDAARENAARAGVAEFTSFETGRLADASPRASAPGFLATNPPYGVRLEDRDGARALMKQLGGVLRANFTGWDAVILAGSPDGRGVDDGQELLEVLGQEAVEDGRVAVLEGGQADVHLERVVLAAQVLELELDLLVDGQDPVREQAAQVERVALVGREGEVLGQQPAAEERRPGQPDRGRTAGGDRVEGLGQRSHQPRIAGGQPPVTTSVPTMPYAS